MHKRGRLPGCGGQYADVGSDLRRQWPPGGVRRRPGTRFRCGALKLVGWRVVSWWVGGVCMRVWQCVRQLSTQSALRSNCVTTPPPALTIAGIATVEQVLLNQEKILNLNLMFRTITCRCFFLIIPCSTVQFTAYSRRFMCTCRFILLLFLFWIYSV